MHGQNQSTKSEIRNLILVIFGGIAGACLLALVMLHYYGPSGRYIVKNILLSPALMKDLAYQDVSPKTGRPSLFAFAGIEFSFFDEDKKKWVWVPVSIEKYAEFYDLISSEVSLEGNSQDLFYKGNLSRLMIRMKTETGEQKIFQEVTFNPLAKFYRIQLRMQSGSATDEIYFYHPNIFNEAMNLFALQP